MHLSPMVVIGVALLVAAGAGWYFMRRTRDELHAMIGTSTSTVSELEEQRRTAGELGGRAGFRQQCELVGSAHPRPEGLLVSELSRAECVWYRYRVEREFREQRHDTNGNTRRQRKKEKIAEHTSHEGYALRDGNGELIGIDPNGAPPDHPEQVVDRFEPHAPEGPRMFGVQLPSFFDFSNTIGYHYKEWVIWPEQQLYVLGEAHDKIGPLVVAKPPKGSFVISTRSEEELRADRRTRHKWLRAGVLAGVPLGIALIVAGFLK